MRRPTSSNMPPLGIRQPYRATPDADGDSHSSTSNSPARQDYEESDFYAANNDSQSSIGVPTFQDMAVSEEMCEQEPLSLASRLPSEILLNIFSKLASPVDLLSCLCVSKLWARNCVDQLWHRPNCTTWTHHSLICRTLTLERPYFPYRDFVKRLNLAQLAQTVNDGSVIPLSICNRVERLTLTKCNNLTDSGLTSLLRGSHHLLALDISEDDKITGESMLALAENCKLLQGLNIMSCVEISNEAMIVVAQNCRLLKRLKLNNCVQISDEAVIAFAMNCPNILEIDLQGCKSVGNDPITALLQFGRTLRELRLVGCDLIDDMAFLSLPPLQTFDHLRILDMTSCARITDRTVEKIIDAAPRLRNVVFAKCRNLTDGAVYSIAKLGKNLHYLHLGHCNQITDAAVIRLVQLCNRIRYIDLGCCIHLTDTSVMKLASLPKLRRIGLVKCSSITDESVYALAQAQRVGSRHRPIRFMGRNDEFEIPPSSLERVHLSYCTNLTLDSIITLLNNCQKLTHLSLTGVQAFLRDDLEQFCRTAPPEFTEHQRAVFCVFSSDGVNGLRNHLNALNTNMPRSDDWDPPGGLARANFDLRRNAAVGANPPNALGLPPPLIAPLDDGDEVDDVDEE